MLLITAFPLLTSLDSFGQESKETIPVIAKDSLPDSLKVRAVQPVAKSASINEDPYYRIDIKEERTYNNVVSRKILSGYKNRNLRSVLISWNTLFPEPLNEFYTVIVEKSFRFPVVFFFLFIIVTLAGNVFVVIAMLFLSNRIMNYRNKQRTKLRFYYEKILTDLMLQAIDSKEAIRQLSKPSQRKNSNLLIEVMMDFQKSFRGDADRLITELYQEMNLGKISYDKTFAISFYKQVEGIRELTNMHPYHATEMIAIRLNDSNDIVRTEAQICYPHVNTELPLDFLNILEKPFSRWAQLNIYYFIKIHELPVPSFHSWLNSSNPNVVNFCLLMINLFQQQENSSYIVEKLQDPNESIRTQAIKTCGDLHLFESKEFMRKQFHKETLQNKIEITKAYRNFGDESDIPFLTEIVRSDVVSLRLEACLSLFSLGEAGRIHLNELNHSMNNTLNPYIAHIQDSRN
ncbi:MAG: HEAT repeat domain-containing protein [Prolixibacteraceae bacterium]